MAHQGISKIIVIIAVVLVVILGVATAIPRLACSGGIANAAKDLEQVRGMGNAFTLYYKKYGYYPALIDMASPDLKTIRQARKAGGQPGCQALKLLLSEGFTEDPICFFDARGEQPKDITLTAMTRSLDPRQDPTFYCNYAYDPGHNPNQGATIFFGTCFEQAQALDYATIHLLTCEQVAKELEANQAQHYVIQNHTEADRQTKVEDDLYADDFPTLAWRDSFLVCDVPTERRD